MSKYYTMSKPGTQHSCSSFLLICIQHISVNACIATSSRKRKYRFECHKQSSDNHEPQSYAQTIPLIGQWHSRLISCQVPLHFAPKHLRPTCLHIIRIEVCAITVVHATWHKHRHTRTLLIININLVTICVIPC